MRPGGSGASLLGGAAGRRRSARVGGGVVAGLVAALSAAAAAASARASGTDEVPASAARATAGSAAEAPRTAGAAAVASPPLHATATLFVEFDEERAWVTEFVEAAPAGPRAVSLTAAERRLAVPAGAASGGHGGLRVGGEPIAAAELVDGALLLPERVPPEGLSAILEYSLPAEGNALSFERRYPVELQALRVSVMAAVPGVTVRLGGGPPAGATREAPGMWAATARRAEPLAPGEPAVVRVSGLPADELPVWASALLAAGVLAALAGLVLARAGRRR